MIQSCYTGAHLQKYICLLEAVKWMLETAALIHSQAGIKHHICRWTESHMLHSELTLASRRILTEPFVFIKDCVQFLSILWNNIIKGNIGNIRLLSIYTGAVDKKKKNQDIGEGVVYSKPSQIGWPVVSLHNWTGYFYTTLTSWAALWHAWPYFFQIFSLILLRCLSVPTLSPLRMGTWPALSFVFTLFILLSHFFIYFRSPMTSIVFPSAPFFGLSLF